MGGSAAIGRELRDHLSKLMRDVMLTAQANLTNATPVADDTPGYTGGHAASNWILSVGEPSYAIDGAPGNPSWELAEQGIRKVQNYDVGRDGKIFIRNNVLYLQFLDRGWSQQAPPGFVAKALQAAEFRAPAQRRAAVHNTLRRMARAAYIRTY